MKISISGHSGIGKTTLAKEISNRYGIPFITTSSKPLWEKHKIENQADIIARSTMDPQWGIKFQCDLVNYRVDELSKYPKYVTDRSLLDNWVYFIINLSAFTDIPTIQAYQALVNQVASSSLYDESSIHIHLASEWDMINGVIEDDNMRVGNPFFQMMVNGVFEQSIERRDVRLPNFTYIKGWDMAHRLERVNDIIQHVLRIINKDTREKFNIKQK